MLSEHTSALQADMGSNTDIRCYYPNYIFVLSKQLESYSGSSWKEVILFQLVERSWKGFHHTNAPRVALET